MAIQFLIIAVAAAVQAPQAVTPPQHHQPLSERPGRAFMSPMGEPVFGRTPGEDGLVAWFAEVDRNHDGVITVDEMIADADRFFDILDTNHDGEIDPDEIAHYETVIAPEVRTRWIATSSSDERDANPQGAGERESHGGGREGNRRGGHRSATRSNDFGGLGGDDEAAAGRFGLLQIPEPVASADSNFDRSVSKEEFRSAAAARFKLLDIDHTGRLTLPELERIREAAEADARRPVRNRSDSGENPQQ